MIDLARQLAKLESTGSGELVLRSGRPPLYRGAQGLVPLPGEAALADTEPAGLLERWLDPDDWERLVTTRHLNCVARLEPLPFDPAPPAAAGARVRVRGSWSSAGVTAQLRLLGAPRSLAELHLPPQLAGLAELDRGLILVTGAAGSGKTLLLASLLQQLAERRRRHIVTLEAPVELLHHSRISSISQREVATHCASFLSGMASALATDADVILAATPSDAEICELAARAAQSTLVLIESPGANAGVLLERLVASSRLGSGSSAALADAFTACIALELLPKKGGGRVPAVEILMASPPLSAALREGKPGSLIHVADRSDGPGGQTQAGARLELLRQGLIDDREVHARASGLG